MPLVRKGKLQDAIKHYNQALRITPDFVNAHNNLGIASLNNGKINGAIFNFSETLRIDPNKANALFNLELAMQKSK
jgi:tetratricopeptide (TPR) repeat protein